ncbi:MAG TPA: GTPase Era [Opitutae bacterium]|nr:GTPase Era [Opitutaceae bacterium]HCR29242.1 GTPase Era [Opitutae bacterium]
MDFGKGRVGYVTLVGRPNAGKSTLLNRLLGYRLSAVSSKPNTTRKRWLGIVTDGESQIIFVDTPGVHRALNRMHRAMKKTVEDESSNGDAVICLCDPTREFGNEDRMAAEVTRASNGPAVLAVNKTDKADKEEIEKATERYLEITGKIPVFEISAQTGEGLTELLNKLKELMPEGPFLFPADQITDSIEREIAEEVVRETAIEWLHDELPQSISALLDSWSVKGKKTRIQASIIVERESQKAIVIGRGGQVIEKIRKSAREKLMAMTDDFVDMKLRVKVVKDWQNKKQFLYENRIVDTIQ